MPAKRSMDSYTKSPPMKASTFLIIILLLLVFSCKSLIYKGYVSNVDRYEGEIQPAFTLHDQNDKEVSLSEFEGKVVYLDFWGTWCRPCLNEIPFADSLKQRLDAYDDLVFLNVADENSPVSIWKNMVRLYKLKGIHLHDPEGELADEYRIEAFPTYVVLGKDGNILGHDVPWPSEPGIIDYVLYRARSGVTTKEALRELIMEKYSDEDGTWYEQQMKKLLKQRER